MHLHLQSIGNKITSHSQSQSVGNEITRHSQSVGNGSTTNHSHSQSVGNEISRHSHCTVSWEQGTLIVSVSWKRKLVQLQGTLLSQLEMKLEL